MVGNVLQLAPDADLSAAGYDARNFDQLAMSEEGHFWFRARVEIILSAVKKHFGWASRFLEIGCGTGLVTEAIHSRYSSIEVYGSELFSEGLNYAAQRLSEVTFFQMDANNIPFRNHFDLVGAFDVIEHIKHDEEVLLQINKALIPGGGLILTVPQHRWLWSRQDEMARHERRYSRKELIRKVHAAEFEVLSCTSFVTFLLPLLFIRRRIFKDHDVSDELRINPLLNTFFGWVMSLECALIALGISLPVGSSLLLVARKK